MRHETQRHARHLTSAQEQWMVLGTAMWSRTKCLYILGVKNRNKFYDQDGTLPHYSSAARTLLDNHLSNRWIGWRGAIEWPARSPDLSICDFFWGAFQDKVFKTSPQNAHQLTPQIEAEITSFPRNIFQAAYTSFLTQCRECRESNGAKVEGWPSEWLCFVLTTLHLMACFFDLIF